MVGWSDDRARVYIVSKGWQASVIEKRRLESMAIGPGKYDDLCTYVRDQVGIAEEGQSGGVIVIVLGGNKGSGFSCQADLKTTLLLPDMLEDVARQMRKPEVKR